MNKSFIKFLCGSTSKINKTREGLLVGYLRIKQFNANASKEMRDALKDLETKNESLKIKKHSYILVKLFHILFWSV